jgi:hypothetical protein
MTVEVKQLGDEPIVIATIYDPVNMETDPVENREKSNAVARKFDGPVYRITDFSNFELTFSQLVGGLAEDIKNSEDNIRHLFVGSGDLVAMQVEAAKQDQYGGQDVKLFTSVNAAIAYARDHLG